MAAYTRHDYDVLVIGAGGAGLRAAIEAASAGVSVGLICKSLLGKAHTVMAEGGIAAALANVDDRDSWKVHFADTMRGGQYVNNWRMAEIHAKEAPDRVRELEAWGAVFDRTTDGRILQRNFGGHRYPRLAHVGDRTGLELIRTLQDHTVHAGVTVHMECTIVDLTTDDGRVTGAFGYDRERGRFVLFGAKAVILATGGIGRAYRITSNSWEGTGDGHALAYRAGASLIDMEFVQFHPTGMVWPPSVQGILVTEGVRGEGGVLRNSKGERFMFGDIPDNYKKQTADNEEEGWRYTQGDKNARRPPELLTRDHVARCINRELKAGRGSPHGGVFLDISWIKEKLPNAEEHIKRKLPSMYHQFKQLADIDITKEADGGRPDDALHHGRRAGGRRLADVDDRRPVCGRRMRLGHQRRQPPRRQLAVRHRRLRQARRRVRGAVRAGARGRRGRARARSRRSRRRRWRRSTAAPTPRSPTRCSRSCRPRCRTWSASSALDSEMREALVRLADYNARAERVGVTGHREYHSGWHTALDLRNLLTVSEAITRSAIERTESRGGHFRDDFPTQHPEWGKHNVKVARGADGAMQVTRIPIPPMPDELRAGDRRDEVGSTGSDRLRRCAGSTGSSG